MEAVLLEEGKDTFTLLSLLSKAAQFKGLKLANESDTHPYTEPIATYVLDRKLLDFLAEHNIRQNPRPDDIFTLVDENWQEERVGWNPSNIWNFKKVEGKNEFDLQMSLLARLGLTSHEDRGIRLFAKVRGSFISACDRLPNFRAFKALVESGVHEVPTVAHELLAGEGSIVVTWTDLGLGGIRNLSTLFMEVFDCKEEVHAIANRGGVFNPRPFGNSVFIAEPAQPRVIRAWREQITNYSKSLIA